MATAREVADYFLHQAHVGEDCGELVSNLKLQKLVYYAQGFSLAIFGKPLFDEDIAAWMHGPVVPALYHDFKRWDDGPIPPPQNFRASDHFTEDEEGLLYEVFQVYDQFSAWKLRNMTHQEAPWLSNKDFQTIITHNELKEYFSTLVMRDDDGQD